MFIESIELSDYRNYSHFILIFIKGRTFLIEIMPRKDKYPEAVYVCSTTKIASGQAKIKKLSGSGADGIKIKMMVRRDGIPYRIDMHLKKIRQRGAVNGFRSKKPVNFSESSM